jgi:imidazoleglycerol-phosphate dehydratase
MIRLHRETRETTVTLELSVGTHASAEIDTPEPFLSHMVSTLARYAGWRVLIRATGDLRHHTVEDVAVTMGLALKQEIPEACARFGSALVPMDDALVQAAVDMGGRAWYQGPVPSRLYDHFLRSLADNAAITVHVCVLRGRDRHHVVEAAFKAVGLALRDALRPGQDVFSTKGAVQLRYGSD